MFYPITPPKRRVAKPAKKSQSPKDEPYVLSLAPFSRQPKIVFDNVVVGQVCRKILLIHNPRSYIIDVEVVKPPGIVVLNWNRNEICASDQTRMEITWRPLQPGTFRDSFAITEVSSRICREIQIILKTAVNEKKSHSKKSPTFLAKKQLVRVPTRQNSFPPPRATNEALRSIQNQPLRMDDESNYRRSTYVINGERKELYNAGNTFTEDDSVYDPRLRQQSYDNPPKSNRYQFNDRVENGENVDPNNRPRNLDRYERVGPKTFPSQCPIASTTVETSFMAKLDVSEFVYKVESRLPVTNFMFTVTPDSKRTSNPNEYYRQLNDSLDVHDISTPRNDFSDVHLRSPDNPTPLDVRKSIFNNISPIRIASNAPPESIANISTTSVTSNILSSTQYDVNFSGREAKNIIEANLWGECEQARGARGKATTECERQPFILHKLQAINEEGGDDYAFKRPFNFRGNGQLVEDRGLGVHHFTGNFGRDVVDAERAGYAKRNDIFQAYFNGTQSQNSSITSNDQFGRSMFNDTTQPNVQTHEPHNNPYTNQNSCQFPVPQRDTRDNFPSRFRAEYHDGNSRLFDRRTSDVNHDYKRRASHFNHTNHSQFTRNDSTKLETSPRKRKQPFNATISPKRSRADCDKSKICRIMNEPAIDPDLLDVDPFLSGLNYDANWCVKKEQQFLRWLNALLTPPSDLDCDECVTKIDFQKLFKEIKTKGAVVLAPSKNTVTLEYLRNSSKLDGVRKKALMMFRDEPVCGVVRSVNAMIDSRRVAIRKDKHLHLNKNSQAVVLNLLLAYNPLWLRIGLEVIYNEIIELQSNSDVVGLSKFVLTRLFQEPTLNKKYYKTKNYEDLYGDAIKIFTLKKLLQLVYFLDQAKSRKLIPHDPLLFRAHADYKDSKQILTEISRELLGSQDLIKAMRNTGFNVTFKQTVLEDYNYCIRVLGQDLRDGVRFARVVEIVLMRNDLMEQMRVPCISRLQKVHNVKVGLDALKHAGFACDDIDANDIVNGHREKTLSLVWRLIHKFESPLYVANVVIIQKWWKSLAICVKKRILIKTRERNRRESAARVIQKYFQDKIQTIRVRRIFLRQKRACISIQKWYRAISTAQKIRLNYLQLKSSTIFVQKMWRAKQMYTRDRRNYLTIKRAVCTIQTQWRAVCLGKIARERFVRVRESTIFVQRRYRAKLMARKCRSDFLRVKNSTIFVQSLYRAKLMMRVDRENYLQNRAMAIFVQKKFRANREMKVKRDKYLRLKWAALMLQEKWRALTRMKIERERFLAVKMAAITIQARFRAFLLAKKQRTEFLTLKRHVLYVQITYHAKYLMRKQRDLFTQQKQAAIFVQRRFRANQLTRKHTRDYKRLLTATILVQRHYRAIVLMRNERRGFLTLKKSVVHVQNRFRANLRMRNERDKYVTLKNAVINVQRRFRAQLLMRKTRAEFLTLKNHVCFIQRKYRAWKSMVIDRRNFAELKRAVIFVQQKFRAQKSARKCLQEYHAMRKSTVFVQQKYRAIIHMRKTRGDYQRLKSAVLFVQRKYRARKSMEKCVKTFADLKWACVLIQRKYRAKIAMERDRAEYLTLKKSAIFVQAQFRMKKTHEKYQQMKWSSITIQRWYRACTAMKIARDNFDRVKRTTILIQRKYRAKLAMERQRADYTRRKTAVLTIQRWYRAEHAMLTRRNTFNRLKTAAITIQRQYRAKNLCKTQREIFLRQKHAAILIQRKYRAVQKSRACRDNYLRLKQTAIFVQSKYRARKLANVQRQTFTRLKTATIFVQEKFRAKLQARHARDTFTRLRNATVFIQGKWRANRAMARQRDEYDRLRASVRFVQEKYRAQVAMRAARSHYVGLFLTVLKCQRRWRAKKLTERVAREFRALRRAVLFVQARFRAKRMMKMESTNYQKLRQSTRVIQEKYRAFRQMRAAQTAFLQMKTATIFIQQKYRANKLCGHDRDHYRRLQLSTVLIQRKWRAKLIARKCRNEYVRLIWASRTIQRWYRTRKVARVREECEKLAARKIQAMWRGYWVRKNSDREIMDINKRLACLRDSCEANTLGNRLKVFLTNTTLRACTNNMQTLLQWTLTYEYFVANHAPEIYPYIYGFLYDMNQSVPEIDLSIIEVNILINLIQNPINHKYIYEFHKEFIDAIDTLLHLMRKSCEKDTDLIKYVIVYIWLLCQNDDQKKLIQTYPDIDKRMKMIYAKTLRKAEMKKRQHKTLKTDDPNGYPTMFKPSALYTKIWGNEVTMFQKLLKLLQLDVTVDV